jgi:hypothetical protein
MNPILKRLKTEAWPYAKSEAWPFVRPHLYQMLHNMTGQLVSGDKAR